MQSELPLTVLRATRRSDRPTAPESPRQPGRAIVQRMEVVHGVFASAVNIATGDGLLTVARDRVGGLPNGVLVAGDPDFRGIGLRPGMTVDRSEHALVVPSARFAVDLRSAAHWSPRLTMAGPRAGALRWRDRSASVHRLVDLAGTPDGLASVPSVRPRLDALATAIDRGDRRSAAAAAHGLIGRGPGLTPSGDDALAGVEAALCAVGHPLAGFVGATLVDIDARTTAVSVALLRHAARGEFAERIHELLGALLGTRAAEIPAAISRAVAWGATSGSDCLAGILLGLDAAADAAAGLRDRADRRRVA